jgi:hypothetical protein
MQKDRSEKDDDDVFRERRARAQRSAVFGARAFSTRAVALHQLQQGRALVAAVVTQRPVHAQRPHPGSHERPRAVQRRLPAGRDVAHLSSVLEPREDQLLNAPRTGQAEDQREKGQLPIRVEQEPVRQEAQSRKEDPGFSHEHTSLIFANLYIPKVSFQKVSCPCSLRY